MEKMEMQCSGRLGRTLRSMHGTGANGGAFGRFVHICGVETPFTILRRLREHVLNVTADLSTEQMNLVPPGFSNNVIWNLAH